MSQWPVNSVQHKAGMVENLLKLDGGFAALTFDEINFSLQPYCTQTASPEFVWCSHRQRLDGMPSTIVSKRSFCTEDWQVCELYDCVFGKAFAQIISQPRGGHCITGQTSAMAEAPVTSLSLERAIATCACCFAKAMLPTTSGNRKNLVRIIC
jgi:hypothetical protein